MFARRSLLALAFVAGLFSASTPFAHGQQPGLKWDVMDLGPFHSGTFKIRDQIVAKGIAIKVGVAEDQAAMLFDPELLRVSTAWTGGFIRIPRGRGGLEGQISPAGTAAFSTGYAPGWAKGEIGVDPRPKNQGNLPKETAKWHGLYTNGGRVILSYAVGGQTVLELPGFEKRGNAGVFTRTFQLGKGNEPRTLLLCDVPGATGRVDGAVARLTVQNAQQIQGDAVTAVGLVDAPRDARLVIGANGRVTVNLPPSPAGATFQVVLWHGRTSDLPPAGDLLKSASLPDLAALCKGGPAHWGAPVETAGKLGEGDGAYLTDEITLPEDNPYKSWLRPGGHDFFPDGTCALVNISGDVWIVSGLDERLEKVKWKRFATGLFQPLGCKVVDGKIYVLGRDQITRLHDLNNDGEADFYENFNNDCVATDNYHEFALDLQTDAAGNFYFAKGSPWTPTVTSPHQGCLLRVSKDGSKLDIVATGLRAPNGLGMGPKDQLTVSDNQGHWIPANRLNWVKPGGFYGMVPAAHKPLKFKTAEGQEFEANPSTEEARREFKTEFWGKANTPRPTSVDAPLCWLPQYLDNSPGGEVWVPPGDKWGPLGGQLLHMSYGKCTLFSVPHETVDGEVQGGVVKFPLRFSSGIMRGRFSPTDGQLYMSGLNVWQSNAARDGCFVRVRYTGKPVTWPIAMHAKKEGIELTFNAALDEVTATDMQNFSVERWNYIWSGEYGSPDISAADPKKKMKDLVLIDALKLSPDKKTLLIQLPDMSPVMQMRIKYKISGADRTVLHHEIHSTINRLPGGSVAVK